MEPIDCYFFIDLEKPLEERGMSCLHVECRNEHFPDTFNLVKIINLQNDISYLFESGNFSEFNGFALYTHRPSYLLNKDFYDDFVTDINRYASSKISDLLTRI